MYVLPNTQVQEQILEQLVNNSYQAKLIESRNIFTLEETDRIDPTICYDIVNHVEMNFTTPTILANITLLASSQHGSMGDLCTYSPNLNRQDTQTLFDAHKADMVASVERKWQQKGIQNIFREVWNEFISSNVFEKIYSLWNTQNYPDLQGYSKGSSHGLPLEISVYMSPQLQAATTEYANQIEEKEKLLSSAAQMRSCLGVTEYNQLTETLNREKTELSRVYEGITSKIIGERSCNDLCRKTGEIISDSLKRVLRRHGDAADDSFRFEVLDYNRYQ